MKMLGGASLFFAGLVVGHIMGTLYGAALATKYEKKTYMNGEG